MYNDYFELLGVEKSFDINQEQLHDNFLKLQQVFHPDKQVNKSSIEKIASIDYASTLNRAYQTLTNDQDRAEYLLSLQGINFGSENESLINLDVGMLEKVLELSENSNVEEISQMQIECIDKFRKYYDGKKFAEATQEIVKLKYLRKIYIP